VDLLIHPTAVVSSEANLAEEVEVGPYVVIGAEVSLGRGTQVGPHAVIDGWTTVGGGCRIGAGAVIGTPPQDADYRGGRSYVQIGNKSVIREYVTIHRASGEEQVTRIGNGAYLMAYSHVGHNCKVGDGVVLTNYVALSGYAEVGKKAVLSGYVGVHQFVKIGTLSLVAAFVPLRKDVPPYTIVEGNPPRVRGLNTVGLRRGGVSTEARGAIKAALHFLLESNLTAKEAVGRIREEVPRGPEVDHLVEFVERSKRGIHR
jgi:UDP-N-acetylglucosamine acyltransferase